MLLALVLLVARSIASDSTAPTSQVDSLIAAERAFAALSLEKGMGPAFVANLADDAILLRPTPVNGQAWFRDHAAPPIILRWKPALAIVAASGELGFTSGPSEVRSKADPAEPPSYGDFVTAWKRQADGAWKVEFDIGVGHAKSTLEEKLVRLFPFPQHADRKDSARMRSELRVRDTAFITSGRKSNMGDFFEMLDVDVRLLRPGMVPLVGMKTARMYLDTLKTSLRRRTLVHQVAASNDLAYTYGEYTGTAGGETAKGYYFTIWRRDPRGTWKVLIDVMGRPLASQ
ncbi:MAG TPA: hypothetical protein VF889_00735 [Bacteroidota bacterium]